MIREEKIGQALYVVNKQAKKIRDARKIVKAKLKRSISMDIMPEMESFITSEGLADFLDLYISGFNGEDYMQEGYSMDRNLEQMELAYDYSSCDYKIECYELFLNEKALGMYESDVDLDAHDPVNWSDATVEEYYKMMDLIEKDRAIISFGDRWFSTANIRKDQLYDLKETVIKKLGIPVIGYHRFSNDSDNVYQLYKLGGYTFHCPIDPYEIDDMDLKIIPTLKKLADITSDIHGDGLPSFKDATETLLDVLEFGDEEKDKYHKGYYASCIAGIELNPKVEKSCNNRNGGGNDDEDDDDSDYGYDDYDDWI